MARRTSRRTNKKRNRVQKKAHKPELNRLADCGTDSLGRPLMVGDIVICLCCGTPAIARLKEPGFNGYDFEGSRWVLAKPWLKELFKKVNEQANDGGLWFKTECATEAYLQSGLRRLHRVIEGEKK